MDLLLPFGDKFYFQQMFRITDLPDDIKSLSIKRRLKNNESVSYSENMIVYTGRRGLHIFDIDQERWVINSKKSGHQYEDVYFKVRNVPNE
jgi:hypothetical protein